MGRGVRAPVHGDLGFRLERGECRALRYGDLAGAEGVSAGRRVPSRWLVVRLAGSHSSG
jgi:hypothetical protein